MIYLVLDNIVKKALKKKTFMFDCHEINKIYKESVVEILLTIH